MWYDMICSSEFDGDFGVRCLMEYVVGGVQGGYGVSGGDGRGMIHR
jgi:hypothetical protein